MRSKYNKEYKKKTRIISPNLVSWNVRKLLDIDTTDRPHIRTALIASELTIYIIDIAALSETRMAREGDPCERGAGYTFFWSGRGAK